MTAVLEVERWSKSALAKMLHECAHQAWLAKGVGLTDESGPQAALGTAFHAALEHHERARLRHLRDGESWTMTRDEVLGWGVSELGIELDKLEPGVLDKHEVTAPQLVEMLAVAIDHWWEAPIPEGQPGAGASLRDRVMAWRPIAVEPYFTARLDESPRPLHGYIDVLYYDPAEEQYVTVDNKSVAHFKSWPLDGRGHELEAAVYAFGAALSKSLPPIRWVRHEWHVARREAGSNKAFQPVRCIKVEPSVPELRNMVDQVVAADNMVEAQEFPKNASWYLCSPRWCSFHVEAGGPCNPDAIEVKW